MKKSSEVGKNFFWYMVGFSSGILRALTFNPVSQLLKTIIAFHSELVNITLMVNDISFQIIQLVIQTTLLPFISIVSNTMTHVDFSNNVEIVDEIKSELSIKFESEDEVIAMTKEDYQKQFYKEIYGNKYYINEIIAAVIDILRINFNALIYNFLTFTNKIVLAIAQSVLLTAIGSEINYDTIFDFENIKERNRISRALISLYRNEIISGLKNLISFRFCFKNFIKGIGRWVINLPMEILFHTLNMLSVSFVLINNITNFLIKMAMRITFGTILGIVCNMLIFPFVMGANQIEKLKPSIIEGNDKKNMLERMMDYSLKTKAKFIINIYNKTLYALVHYFGVKINNVIVILMGKINKNLILIAPYNPISGTRVKNFLYSYFVEHCDEHGRRMQKGIEFSKSLFHKETWASSEDEWYNDTKVENVNCRRGQYVIKKALHNENKEEIWGKYVRPESQISR